MLYQTIFMLLALLVIPAVSQPFAADAETPQAIEAKADEVLKKMSVFLDSLEQFTIHAESSVDMLMASGQKLQRTRSVDVLVRRPDRLRVDIEGDVLAQQITYDGSRVTLYGKKVNFYAGIDVSGGIEDALDHAEQAAGLVVPAADLVYRNAYRILTEDVLEGFYVGLSTVGGVPCHHLAFRAVGTDWQIWVEDSDTPFPRKFVITSKWVAGAPQFTALLNQWNPSVRLEDKQFTFVPAPGAKQIEFLSTPE